MKTSLETKRQKVKKIKVVKNKETIKNAPKKTFFVRPSYWVMRRFAAICSPTYL